MSDNAEAVPVETIDGVRALRQENQILTELNRSLTGEVSDQRVVIIQILTRIERLEAYAQNSQNGFRVQFSPLATQELHAMGRRMEQIDRNNAPAPARQASSTLTNSVGRAQNSAPMGCSAATTRGLLIGTNQAMAREAVQPALNAPNARAPAVETVAAPNNENEAPRFHARLENRMNAARHRVLIQATMQDPPQHHQDSLGHNAAVVSQLREVERFNGRGIPLAPPQTLYWADECAVCNDGEANFYSRNCGHICLCDACAVNLVIHSRVLRCIICRRAANSSPRFQFAYRP